jgi:hypothetical protein
MHGNGEAASFSLPPTSFVSETVIAFHLNIVCEMHIEICWPNLILFSVHPLLSVLHTKLKSNFYEMFH